MGPNMKVLMRPSRNGESVICRTSLGDRLHPVADDGQRLRGEEDAELAVIEGSERARKSQLS